MDCCTVESVEGVKYKKGLAHATLCDGLLNSFVNTWWYKYSTLLIQIIALVNIPLVSLEIRFSSIFQCDITFRDTRYYCTHRLSNFESNFGDLGSSSLDEIPDFEAANIIDRPLRNASRSFGQRTRLDSAPDFLFLIK